MTHRQRESARYYLYGVLKTDTALHIGSGYGNAATDAAVVRDLHGQPYVPGSSFKGVLRSTIERTIGGVANAQIATCQLSPGAPNCLTTNAQWQQDYSKAQEAFVRNQDEAKLVAFLDGAKGICDLCRLFGSPASQSRAYFTDLPLLTATPEGEVRHGVGIDRTTLTARDRIKFDYEVLPSQRLFRVELILDRPAPLDWALLALGLQEMRLGFVPLGGLRSRGLGRATLELDALYRVALNNKTALIDFLKQAQPVGNTGAPTLPASAALPPEETLLAHLNNLQEWL